MNFTFCRLVCGIVNRAVLLQGLVGTAQLFLRCP